MALNVHFVLLEPADVELLARGATLELAGHVLFVVANNSVQVYVSKSVPNDTIETAKLQRTGRLEKKTYLVMRPVVLTPSVRWVTRNLPASFIG